MTKTLVLMTAVALLLALSNMALAAGPSTLVALEGRTLISGNAPFLVTRFVAGDTGYQVTGVLSGELRHLQEIPIRVVGWHREAIKPGLGPFLEVLAYAPVTDGYGKSPKALTGILLKQREDWLLVDLGSARLFQLVGKLPPGLEGANGAKVYLQGKAAKGQVTLLGFVATDAQIVAPAGKYHLGGEE